MLIFTTVSSRKKKWSKEKIEEVDSELACPSSNFFVKVKRQAVPNPGAVFFDAIFFLALKYGRGYIVGINLFSKGANNMNNMMTNELEQKLQQDETIQLIDVREPDEYAGGHIKQAKNVPLSELTERTNELDPSRPLHVICLSGGRSMNAAMYLEQAGFDVTNVDGGMMSWEENVTR